MYSDYKGNRKGIQDVDNIQTPCRGNAGDTHRGCQGRPTEIKGIVQDIGRICKWAHGTQWNCKGDIKEMSTKY